MGKVRRTVIAHGPMEDTPGVVSHLRIYPRTGITWPSNPSLLEVETSIVCPSDPHSISFFSPLLTQRGGFSPGPIHEKENVQPSVAGQSYHITGNLWGLYEGRDSILASNVLVYVYTSLLVENSDPNRCTPKKDYY